MKTDVHFVSYLACFFLQREMFQTKFVGEIKTFLVFFGIVTFMRLTLRRLMSYIYGAPILDVSRSHTTTQHSR